MSFPRTSRPGLVYRERVRAGRLFLDARGLSTVEYVIILVLITSVAVFAWKSFGESIRCALAKHGFASEEEAQMCSGGFSELAPPPPGSAGCGGGPGPQTGASAQTTPTADTPAARRAVAAQITAVKGTATEADRQLVLNELQKLPVAALQALKDGGYKVAVVHNDITEMRPDLAKVQPQGHPPGAAWQTVPGMYDGGNKTVIIATRNGSIPQSGNGHGSQNLVLHETAHAVDAAVNGRNDPTFVAARNKDLPNLSSYETQSGTAGPRETYAESLARYYDNPAKAGNSNLDKYWATDPLSKP